MVGNRNHPLNQPHVDEDTLHVYIWGHLPPEETEHILRHLEHCPRCRALESGIRAAYQQIRLELQQELDRVTPAHALSFDQIAAGWHQHPRQNSLSHRIRRLAPGATLALLFVLFVAAILTLMPAEQSVARRALHLADDYSGPPAVVAASTEKGLFVVRLSPGDVDVIAYLSHIYNPRRLLWSTDGRWLAFQQGGTLYLLAAQANTPSTRLPVHDSADWAWSPDGRWLAYTDGNGQLAVLDPRNQHSRVLVPATESAWGPPVWTADSQQIAYAVIEPLPTQNSVAVRQSLWRVTVETGYRAELARSPSPGEMLLLPSAWDDTTNTLLAWDIHAATAPVLYRVNSRARSLERLDGNSVASGTRLAWPVSSQGALLLARENRLIITQLDGENIETPLALRIPWPQSLEWAPNGEWVAFTTAGAAAGEGVYLFALDQNKLQAVKLPAGAVEKKVWWAGAEHVFVIRQPADSHFSELWMAPLTGDGLPQRIMTQLRLPPASPYNGWRWTDVLAVQVIITPPD